MPQVSVRIGARSFDLACGDGQEDRLHSLAADVDDVLTELRAQSPNSPEARLLVLAALMLADRAREARVQADAARAAIEAPRAERPEGELISLHELFSAVETRIETITRKVAAA